jgi:signal transduction histidine kinase
MLSGIAEKSGIRILNDLEKDSPVLIPEDDLYQIVFNLIENGIKYNTSGGKVTVTLEREEDNAILRIADNGVGIPKESLGKIFDRFYRVDKARSRKSGSSGLGLSIVRGIVELNQGAIRVTSELGKGSAFTVSFPVFDTEEVEQ